MVFSVSWTASWAKCYHSLRPAIFRALAELDSALESILPADTVVATAVGVLMLTSAEFWSIVSQSECHIAVSANNEFDLVFEPFPTLAIPSIMGITQQFPIDLGVLFPGKHLEGRTVKIRYPELMFAVLKACLRNAVLEIGLDSGPLFDAFVNMSDKVCQLVKS
jgi:hypothetical protein